MNENLQNKVNLVSEIKDKLSRAKTVVFVELALVMILKCVANLEKMAMITKFIKIV